MPSEYSFKVICQKCGEKIDTFPVKLHSGYCDFATCEECGKIWNVCDDEEYRNPKTAEQIRGGKA